MKKLWQTHLLGAIVLFSCATSYAANPTSTTASQATPTKGYYDLKIDPYENYNRNAFRLNQTLDKHFVRPVAVAYFNYVPSVIRKIINNFYNNLRDFVTLGDDLLQFQGQPAMKTTMRIGLNTTIGLFGIIDVASSLGLPQHKNTFGNTMKFYGWKNSSYFILPFFGPSTVRDSIGMVPDIYFNPTWIVIDNTYGSIALFATSSIDARTKYLGVDQLQGLALDPYIALRDTYLQATGSQTSKAQGINIDSELLDDESQTTTESTTNNLTP